MNTHAYCSPLALTNLVKQRTVVVDEHGQVVLDQVSPRHTQVHSVPVFKLAPHFGQRLSWNGTCSWAWLVKEDVVPNLQQATERMQGGEGWGVKGKEKDKE